MRSALLLCAVVALAGCAVGPDYERPDIDLPQSAFASTLLSQQQRKALAYWWTRYRDPTLNKLIDEALDSNLDIALQAQKVRQARAELGYQNAQLYPSIQGQAQGMRERVGSAVPGSSGGASSGGGGSGASGGGSGGSSALSGGGAGSGGGPRRFNEFSVAATLSYELDFWGALRRADEQARARLLSSAYTQDSIRLQTIADVVTNYMSLRSYQRQIRVTKRTIKTRVKGYHLDQKRYQYGAINKLTLLQTKSLLQSARAQLPPLEQQASRLRTSLAILTGRTPRVIMAHTKLPAGDFSDLTLPRDLPVVLPSTLLNRRPDIRAAEASLIAANANVGVAKARFFPTFNLSAMIGTEALDISDLFEPYSEIEQIGGTITAPILDFGRINAQYRSAKAQKAQAEIRYRQTVRQAFREVRNALDEVKFSRQRFHEVQQQVEAYRQTLKLAKLRYQVGRTNYFDVLDAQRNLFSSQLSLAQAIADRFTATADLYKALGGGWTKNSDSLTPAMQEVVDDYKPVEGAKDGAHAATTNTPVPGNDP
ncbi:efflux transporter outer membrane subunit [Salinisphaera sp.]|uniref:efflux transporter outer membrane subunit n=1 Tax=Salinisphaera sp. TaxID=1914330 RepID=UPI002D7780B3|nr:efflux transporter outer membrane subunit [Salinisphaera sp.]HET7314916.1 efflux transporter outer membrane subunit [Salinisphaera sp.]